MNHLPKPTEHIPILLKPIVQYLTEPFQAIHSPAVLLDCTLGGGGHTGALLDALPEHHRILSVDQDLEAIKRATLRFQAELQTGRLSLIHARFGDLNPEVLRPFLKGQPLMGILADLGMSSDQLNDGNRGISFLHNGPLDMRLNKEGGEPVYDLLMRLDEKEIADIIYEFGEERHSRRIARYIIEARQRGELSNQTHALSELVRRAYPPKERFTRIHPATRTFQALRIFVNEELEELDKLLNRVILNLSVGGRVAIMSFHSLEDRRVKNTFKAHSDFKALTKKPLEPDEEEVKLNPRSRSAKLRVAERIEV
jgi:16S rRNA (cytosine1402-N4)-methyltransferase